MTARRPRPRMRPVDAIDSGADERIVRRSEFHRRRLRAMARTRRWFRRFRRSIAVVLLLLGAGVLALAQTGRGQELALDFALDRVRGALAGELSIGGVRSGTLFSGASLVDVRLTASDGRHFLVADSVAIRYSILNAILGGPPIRSTVLWGLDLEISRHAPGEPMNLSLLLAEGPPRPDSVPQETSSPLRLGRVGIRGGRVLIRTPTDDPDGARVAPGPTGHPLRTVAFERLDLDVESAVLDVDAAIQFEARLASFTSEIGIVEEPLVLREAFGQVTFGPQGVRVTEGAFRLQNTLLRGDLTVGPRRPGDSWSFRSQLRTDGWGDLDDVRWVDARIPEGRFRGATGIDVEGGVTLSLTGAEVELEASTVAFDGRVRFADEMVVQGMRLRANPLVLERLEPWLERELPVDGWLSGDAFVDGTLDDFDASGRITFVPTGLGGGVTTADFSGGLRLGENFGASSFRATLRPFDYAVMGAILPELPWSGQGDAVVELDGALRGGLTVDADFRHVQSDGLESRARVTGALAREAVDRPIRSELDIELEPLHLGLVAGFVPELDLRGEVEGTARVEGPPESLVVSGDLTSEGGRLRFRTAFDAANPLARYEIDAEAEDLLVSRVVGRAPEPTLWTGSFELSGSGAELDSLALSGSIVADASRFGPVRLDGVRAALHVEDGMLVADSLRGDVAGVDVAGRGRLGLVDGTSGTAQLDFSSSSLVGLRPFVMGVPETVLVRDGLTELQLENYRLQGIDPDTLPAEADVRLEGRVQGTASVTGHLQDFDLGVVLDVFDGQYRTNRVDTVRIGVTARGLPERTGAWQIGASARGILWADREFERGGFEADMLDLDGDGRIELVRRPGEQYRAVGSFAFDSVGGRIALSDATVQIDEQEWRLTRPGIVGWSPASVTVDSVEVVRQGQDPMRLRAAGTLARGGDSDFRLSVEGLHVEQVMHVLQIDEPELAGHVDVDFDVSGPAEAPRIDGTFDVLGARLDALQLTRLRGTLGYEGRRLSFRTEGRDGVKTVLRASGDIPLDLSMQTVEERVVDAPMNVRIEADSLDAGIALSYVSAFDNVVGLVSGTVDLRGTPRSPEPEGEIRLERGAWSIDAIGVRHTGVSGALTLRPDRTVDVRLTATGPGRSDVNGTIMLDPVSDPALSLDFTFQRFLAVSRTDIEGTVTGDFHLGGRYRQPTAEGSLVVDAGTIYVDELQRAAGIVDLSDPLLLERGLAVDTTALVARPIFEGLSNPFFDNLRVNVDLSVPRGTWLRSLDTNIELSGDLLVLYDRQADDFVLLGELEALRGSHRVLGRSFELDGGSVNFIGRAGLNPDLDIDASTQIRRPDDAPFRIQANVGGTLIRPVVTLSSEESGLAEQDLVSYVVFGQPTGALGVGSQSQLAGIGSGVFGSIVGGGINQVGTAVGRRIGLDYVSVQGGYGAASYFDADTQVEVGRYLGDEIFLIVVVRPFDTGAGNQNTVGGVRVEVAATDRFNYEFFVEDRFLRSSSALTSASGLLENQAKILGVFLFREWGYGAGSDPQDR